MCYQLPPGVSNCMDKLNLTSNTSWAELIIVMKYNSNLSMDTKSFAKVDSEWVMNSQFGLNANALLGAPAD